VVVSALRNPNVGCRGFSFQKGRRIVKHLPELTYGVCTGPLVPVLEDALLQHGRTSSIKFSFKSSSTDEAYWLKGLHRAKEIESSNRRGYFANCFLLNYYGDLLWRALTGAIGMTHMK